MAQKAIEQRSVMILVKLIVYLSYSISLIQNNQIWKNRKI
jgi:hypothetical protein